MGWLGTIIIGVISGAVAMFAAGYVAQLIVGWYHISSFEGGAGYFVVFTALGALIAGFVLGLIVARIVAAGGNPSFIKGLGSSLVAVLFIAGTVGGIARLKADIPPQMDGEELMLVVEARWPATRAVSPAEAPGVSSLTLGSSSGHVQRVSKQGALWKEDAHLVDGRWTVPGAVEIFTTRGTPTLTVSLNDKEQSGFILGMPSRPSKKQLEWSPWFPLNGKGGAPIATEVNYRYRVQKRGLPMRTDSVGPFAIDAIVYAFTDDVPTGTTTFDAFAQFALRYRGKPVHVGGSSNASVNSTSDGGASGAPNGVAVDPARLTYIALLPGDAPALLALVQPQSESSYCAMFTEENGAVKETRVSSCSNSIQADQLPSDSTRFDQTPDVKLARGRLDRHAYLNSQLLLFHRAVFDVRKHVLHPFTASSPLAYVPNVRPLGVSPDEHSFARYANGANDGANPAIVVTDFIADRVYELEIDPARMRFGVPHEDLDPAWLMHYFKWEKQGGIDHLVVRPNFVPIPYHGKTVTDSNGQSTYSVNSATQAIRVAIVDMITKEFKGARTGTEPDDDYRWEMKVEEQKLNVAYSSDSHNVMVSLDYGEKATDLVPRIAKRIDAMFATGQHDSEFQHHK